MTAGQKKNIERLKKLQAKAKALKFANPKLTHIEAIKIAAGKKIGAAKTGNKEITYKGETIKKLFPSGMYEFYSNKQGRFLKFDNLQDAKNKITLEKSKTVGAIKRKKPTKKITERVILSQSHKVKNAANKLDELQHEHMLQKSIGSLSSKYIAVYTNPKGIQTQLFKTTSLMEAKKLATGFKKLHNIKGTLKVQKFSHL